jgi:hypothetical protein
MEPATSAASSMPGWPARRTVFPRWAPPVQRLRAWTRPDIALFGEISIFCERISRGKRIEVFGMIIRRDFIFVTDVIIALLRAMDSRLPGAPVFKYLHRPWHHRSGAGATHPQAYASNRSARMKLSIPSARPPS